MEELLANQPDDLTIDGLDHFLVAHKALMMKDTSMAEGSKDHSEPIILLEGRRVELLGKMERFRDQGESMCQCAGLLMFLEKKEDAASMFQKARDVGAAHGFFSVESQACLGLGKLLCTTDRRDEGLELLRNALVEALCSQPQTLNPQL